MAIKNNKILCSLVALLAFIIFWGFSINSAQASSTAQEAQTTSLTTQVVEKKKPDLAKCLIGGGGSALLGFASGGPIGYWGGAAVGYATFCR